MEAESNMMVGKGTQVEVIELKREGKLTLYLWERKLGEGRGEERRKGRRGGGRGKRREGGKGREEGWLG